MIYFSTGGLSKKNLIQIFKLLENTNIRNIELTGGKFFSNTINILNFYKKKFKYKFHNYFPVPKKKFIMNLASTNKEILKLSMHQAMKCIKLSQKFSTSYYSVHAGFAVDPIYRLRKFIFKKKKFNINNSKKIFFSSLYKLSDYAYKLSSASKKKIIILIENNVINKKNFLFFNKKNPLLFTTPEEINELMQKVPRNIRLLLDVAHLKVSSKTLGFNLTKGHKMIKKFIFGYHLSDNNGLNDTNDKIKNNSWFWKDFKRHLKYYSLEIYNNDFNVIQNQINLVRKKLND